MGGYPSSLTPNDRFWHLDRFTTPRFGIKFQANVTFDSHSPIAFSHNCQLVAFPGQETWIILAVGSKKKTKCNTPTVAFSSDGTWMVSVSSAEIDSWNLATGKCLAHLRIRRPISKISFDIDGSSIIASTYEGYTKSWSLSSGPGALDQDYHDSSKNEKKTSPYYQ
jgi:hypothetical protein